MTLSRNDLWKKVLHAILTGKAVFGGIFTPPVNIYLRVLTEYLRPLPLDIYGLFTTYLRQNHMYLLFTPP